MFVRRQDLPGLPIEFRNDILENVRQYSNDDTQILPPTTVLSSKSDDLILNKAAWKSVFHDKYGGCWTLDSKYWHR